MNYCEFGAGAMLVLLFVGGLVYVEIRIRKLEGSLVVSNQRVIDDSIVQKVHSLSDADLHALSAEFLGGDKPKT